LWGCDRGAGCRRPLRGLFGPLHCPIPLRGAPRAAVAGATTMPRSPAPPAPHFAQTQRNGLSGAWHCRSACRYSRYRLRVASRHASRKATVAPIVGLFRGSLSDNSLHEVVLAGLLDLVHDAVGFVDRREGGCRRLRIDRDTDAHGNRPAASRHRRPHLVQ